ncbi:MAG: hypothetical protein KatS3mg076_0579 [Candidatus Binatia bacterium]|nr:MAG: hypothetical protein KatS3mg076_0579 [Candidatus Binatia bacterium]
MAPVLFRLWGFEVESFWVFVFLGFAAATWAGYGELRRHGLDPSLVYDLVLYAYVGGLVGARLFLVFTEWDVVRTDPWNFLLSGSGWVWQGGLLGGTLAVLFAVRRLGLPPVAVADAAGLALPLGQAVGRIGCQLAGDGDYGVPSDLPWAMSYPRGVVPTFERVHPTPIYESLGLFFLFLWLRRRRGREPAGALFGWYLVGSGILRWLVEFVRRNPAVFLGWTLAQWLSLLSVGVGLLWLSWVRAAGNVRAADR